jgi:hypothetical protein
MHHLVRQDFPDSPIYRFLLKNRGIKPNLKKLEDFEGSD